MKKIKHRFQWEKSPKQLIWNKSVNLRVLKMILIAKKFDRTLALGSLPALLFILVFDILFSKIPEWFIGASNLGKVFYELSFAYLASTIFYFVTIHWRLEQKKLVML
jgi:hypothetical protein